MTDSRGWSSTDTAAPRPTPAISRPTFDSPEQAARMLAVQRQNQRREGEGTMAYMERIAVLSGLVRPEDAVLNTLADFETDERIERAQARMPYRDARQPGEEG